MFVAAMHKAAEAKGSALFSVSELKQLVSESPALRREVTDIEDFIELLNHQNYILKKGTRLCVLCTRCVARVRALCACTFPRAGCVRRLRVVARAYVRACVRVRACLRVPPPAVIA